MQCSDKENDPLSIEDQRSDLWTIKLKMCAASMCRGSEAAVEALVRRIESKVLFLMTQSTSKSVGLTPGEIGRSVRTS